MKREITMWEYPYSLGTFFKNIKEYGLTSSLRHDLDRTKEDIVAGLESLIYGALLTAACVIAIPYGVYQASRKSSKKEKERSKLRIE